MPVVFVSVIWKRGGTSVDGEGLGTTASGKGLGTTASGKRLGTTASGKELDTTASGKRLGTTEGEGLSQQFECPCTPGGEHNVILR